MRHEYENERRNFRMEKSKGRRKNSQMKVADWNALNDLYDHSDH